MKGQNAPKKSKSEGEEIKIRQKIRDIIDDKWVILLMTLVTLWALFGDDLRLFTTSKNADYYFYISFIVILILFILEIFFTSLVVDDYKYSFFFWLDIIASVSLVLDIPYLIDPIISFFGGTVTTADVTLATTSSANNAQGIASKVLKSFRLIRLVRIVKLYKYFTKRESEEQEQRLKEVQRQAKTARQAAMNREMDPDRLGKKLSDIITRRVIIVVLLMIIFVPIMQVNEDDNSSYYGLKQLFWMGRSSCHLSDDECQPPKANWINNSSICWEDLVYRYSKSSQETDGKKPDYPLLWLRTPNYYKDGKIEDISSIEDNYGKNLWETDYDCSGKSVSSNCNLRDSEMLLAVYNPSNCSAECENIQVYSRFDISSYSKDVAMMNIIVTIFIGVILAIASVTFTVDTQTIVIVPITKMILIIKSLADDPLKKIEETRDERTEEKFDIGDKSEDEQNMLQATVEKISSLLQISFGEDGSEILSKNIMSGEGELNLMRPGNKISLVILTIRIDNFALITECLDLEITIFLNKVCHIVHNCVKAWSGLVAKSSDGYFTLVWRLPELLEKDTEEDDLSNPAMQRTDLANRALVALVKIISEIRRSSDLQFYKFHPKISTNMGEGFEISISAGLHVGWCIEGVIGSDMKIDASYLSPHIYLAMDLLKAIERYKVPILMTEEYYGYLSIKAKTCCRRIDTVTLPYIQNQFGIYTFDINSKDIPEPEGHVLGQLIKLQELDSVNVENFQHKGVDYMFTLDSDIVGLQRDIPAHFFDSFRHAYVDYISGQWDEAKDYLDKAMAYKPQDGPSLTIKNYIDSLGGKPAEDWSKTRSLLDSFL
ncbi:hypothetical protein SteCoe_36024 [Stentor coeruleus]|uniref:Guanylate cyclase domain-containing protein n=1 Tax=Stentor coeruleus TaxID=5963 RepID=A0A1R2ARC1_9CILI|nr:hypothetical protein SteCoe_36024 [Stentor coeruleus]